MLTLVAVVLAYDLVLDMRDARSSAVVATEAPPVLRAPHPLAASRRLRSCTRLEKDMIRAQSIRLVAVERYCVCESLVAQGVANLESHVGQNQRSGVFQQTTPSMRSEVLQQRLLGK